MKIKGIYQDSEIENQPESYARYIKNMLVNKSLGDLSNENGFELLLDIFEETGKEVCGFEALNDDKAIVFLVNDELGVVDLKTSTYSSVYINSELNFSKEFPIKIEFHKNFKDQF